MIETCSRWAVALDSLRETGMLTAAYRDRLEPQERIMLAVDRSIKQRVIVKCREAATTWPAANDPVCDPGPEAA